MAIESGAQRIGGRKFDNENSLRHRTAFEQIDLSATGDDAAAETSDCRQRARQMSFKGGGIVIWISPTT
jgi:hypothetical protein